MVGWRGYTLPNVLIRIETPVKGILVGDSWPLPVRGVGPLADSSTVLFPVRSSLCISFPHLQNGAAYFQLLSFLGPPSLSFLYLEVGRWDVKLGEGGRDQITHGLEGHSMELGFFKGKAF